MLELTLHQTEQNYLSAPSTTLTSVPGPELTDKGGTSDTPSRLASSVSETPTKQTMQVSPDQHVGREEPSPGYTYLSDDDPFFEAPGIHAKALPGPTGPVSARTRSARRAAGEHADAQICIDSASAAASAPSSSPNEHVSDCVPAFVAHAAFAATDLATDHAIPKNYKQARPAQTELTGLRP